MAKGQQASGSSFLLIDFLIILPSSFLLPIRLPGFLACLMFGIRCSLSWMKQRYMQQLVVLWDLTRFERKRRKKDRLDGKPPSIITTNGL
ncbi:hypothetical protein GGR53DRAFT_489630 [Hypoxylon sp. FL1150]|nr:hypothetical protein GGR53DRAFT_489630 [Hypoxylon sp. FL1150]